MERKKRAGLKIPEVLTSEEQAALLRVPNKRYPTGERNKLLLRLMLDTGLRVSEAAPYPGRTSTSIPASLWSVRAKERRAAPSG